MKSQHPLFSKVALAQDLPDYGLKRGDVATIVEYYPMAEDEEDGYSLEGFNVPGVTLEVGVSQVISLQQWQRESVLLSKIRQLSDTRLTQLDQYIDMLVQEDKERSKSA